MFRVEKMDNNLNEKLADLQIEMGNKMEVSTKLHYESNEEKKGGRFTNPPNSNDDAVLLPKVYMSILPMN